MLFINIPHVISLTIYECGDGRDNDKDGRIDWGYTNNNDKECDSPFDTNEEDYDYGNVNWSEFPEFNLSNFVIVYMAINAENNETAISPLNHGFSHLDPRGTNEYGKDVQYPNTRSFLWTGVAFPCQSSGGSYGCETNWELNHCTQEQIDFGQCKNIPHVRPNTSDSSLPWEKIYSPWNNNLSVHNDFWNGRLKWHANDYNDTIGKTLPNVSLIVPDVEKRIYNPNNPLDDYSILKIRGSLLIPDEINSLSDNEFVDSYKREMAKLYYEPLKKARKLGYKDKISYYGIDSVPVTRTIYGISDYSWEEWSSNWSFVDYNVKNFTRDNNDSRFYNEFGPLFFDQDYLSPSSYIITPDYPNSTGRLSGRGELDRNNEVQWNLSGQYLAYQLFQLEVNEAWSMKYNKSILLWQWMEFHPGIWGGQFAGLPIRPHMAQASAIFPFMDGANGIFLYGENRKGKDFRKVHHNYIYGLYRLSLYKEFFNGKYEIYRPKTAHEEVNNFTHVWRGIINKNELLKNKMLIAMHNPYAMPNEITNIPIIYNNSILGIISINGLNTWLGICNLNGSGCFGNEGIIKRTVRYEKFKNRGKTTNLENLSYQELQEVNLTLDDGIYGRIEFIKYVNLTNNLENSDEIKLDEIINISFNKIEIKTEEFPGLNKSAIITFNNLTLTSPIILKNKEECEDCTILFYRNGSLEFNVTSFSVYEANESSNVTGNKSSDEGNKSEDGNGNGSGNTGGEGIGEGGGGGGGGSSERNKKIIINSVQTNKTNLIDNSIVKDFNNISLNNYKNNNYIKEISELKIKDIKIDNNKLIISYYLKTSIINENVSIIIWINDEEGKEKLSYYDSYYVENEISERTVELYLENLVGIYDLIIAKMPEKKIQDKRNIVIGKQRGTGYSIIDEINEVNYIKLKIFIYIIAWIIFFIFLYYIIKRIQLNII